MAVAKLLGVVNEDESSVLLRAGIAMYYASLLMLEALRKHEQVKDCGNFTLI